jgi:hypothetical protein
MAQDRCDNGQPHAINLAGVRGIDVGHHPRCQRLFGCLHHDGQRCPLGRGVRATLRAQSTAPTIRGSRCRAAVDVGLHLGPTGFPLESLALRAYGPRRLLVVGNLCPRTLLGPGGLMPGLGGQARLAWAKMRIRDRGVQRFLGTRLESRFTMVGAVRATALPRPLLLRHPDCLEGVLCPSKPGRYRPIILSVAACLRRHEAWRFRIDHGWAMGALDDARRGRHGRRVVSGDMALQRFPPLAPFRGRRRSKGREASRLFRAAGARLVYLVLRRAAGVGA